MWGIFNLIFVRWYRKVVWIYLMSFPGAAWHRSSSPPVATYPGSTRPHLVPSRLDVLWLSKRHKRIYICKFILQGSFEMSRSFWSTTCVVPHFYNTYRQLRLWCLKLLKHAVLLFHLCVDSFKYQRFGRLKSDWIKCGINFFVISVDVFSIHKNIQSRGYYFREFL